MTVGLRDKPRPPGYWPDTPNQFREPSVDDCTWYATEAAFQSQSNHHLSFHPVEDLRSKSSDRVGGTPVSVALRETQRLWPDREDTLYRYGGEDLTGVRRSLTVGEACVVGGDYERLPAHYRKWTNNDIFDHAMMHMYLDDNDRTFLYDPLGGGPQRLDYDGEWIPLTELYGPHNFVWMAGREHLVGIVSNRKDDAMTNLFIPSETPATREARLKNPTPGYKRPQTNSNILRHFRNADRWWPFFSQTDNGFVLIGWTEDGRNEYAYVAQRDILNTRAAVIPPPPIPGDGSTIIEGLRQELGTLKRQLINTNIQLDNAEATIAAVRTALNP